MKYNANNRVPKFGMMDKLAYAAGDFGCNMSFALKGTLTIFWTQYIGIDELLMASLFLIVQVWDAINDPMVGAMLDADRRQYKRNKFLQYIHIGSIGLIVGGGLCFLPVAGLSDMMKNIVFISGYIIWDAFYTVANVPYGSILSLISADAGDRAELSAFRSAGSMAGNIVTSVLLPILIYDASNNLLGDRVFIIALVMGILGFCFFQFMIRKTVIRVEVENDISQEKQKFNIFEAVGRFFKNRAAVGATLVPVAQFIGMYAATTANTVMWQCYFKNAQISGLMQIVTMVPMFFLMPFVRVIVDKFGKKEASAVGMLVSTIAYAALLVLPVTPDKSGIIMWVVCSLIAGMGASVNMCVSWSLMADAMDYGEWKFGVREEGTLYALHSFFRKLAQGIGPSLGLVLAVVVGYDASLGAAQPDEVAVGLKNLVIIINTVCYICQFAGIAFVYNLDKRRVSLMQSELEARRELLQRRMNQAKPE